LLSNFKKRINSSIILCIILFIWNTLYVIEAIRLGSPIRKGQVDVSFFPLVIAILMYIAIFYVFISSYKYRPKKKTFYLSLKKINKPLLIIILTIVYILLFKIIGYMLSSILYIFSIIYIFETNRRNFFIKIIYAIIIAILIFLLYEKLFLIRLPKLGGIL